MADTGESVKPDLAKVLLFLSSQFSLKDLDHLRGDRRSVLKRKIGPFTCILGFFDKVSDRDAFIAVVADDAKEETVLVGFWRMEPEEFSAHTVGPRFPELIDLIT